MRTLMGSMASIIVIAIGLAVAGPDEVTVGAGITAAAATALTLGAVRAHAAAALAALLRPTMVRGLD
ncbi:MAG: hypothetical protein JNK64_01920 [Myxococcales bacterium]|nr:hypothetical protein [Myxococcales bacterium]